MCTEGLKNDRFSNFVWFTPEAPSFGDDFTFLNCNFFRILTFCALRQKANFQ